MKVSSGPLVVVPLELGFSTNDNSMTTAAVVINHPSSLAQNVFASMPDTVVG